MKNYMKIFFLILLIPSLSYATFNNNKVSLKRALCESNSKSWCQKHLGKCKTPPKEWCAKKYPGIAL
ncbi:MAG TPA: hypothetical protein DCZ80_07670 [Legionellales bacterium]|nr:hypothetical protein [Legionellales bacterium]